jgi:hypothetical protein
MPRVGLIDLDRNRMQHLGFEATVGAKNDTVFLQLEYPATIDEQYHPVGVEVVSKKGDRIIPSSTTRVSERTRYIDI